MTETRFNRSNHCLDRGPVLGWMDGRGKSPELERIDGKRSIMEPKLAEVERCLRLLEEDRLLAAHLAESAEKGDNNCSTRLILGVQE